MTRSELLQKLKAKRKALADREGVELFMVFTNKALEEMVKAMPATREDLALVKGWGKTKIAKYGAEVLDIFHDMDQAAREQSAAAAVSAGGAPPPTERPAVFSVAEFLDTINSALAKMRLLRVQGEVSELKHRGSVVYFTLKDTAGADASVKCVVWAWKYEREYDYLEDGMEIIIDGAPEIYAKYGSFDMRVERIVPVGEGALQKAFEALKKKLSAKGYFDEARKRPLPAVIQRVGVVTSEKGEAINDFLKNIGSYGFEIVLMDVRVEGDRAEQSIAAALGRMNTQRPDLDALCLIRGGGGLENLKAFNSERVAHAVVVSRIPVLTGIGHERDVTIAGLSSDADFSTPTKVADTIRRGREDLLRGIARQADTLLILVEAVFDDRAHGLTALHAELARQPMRIITHMHNRVSMHTHRLETAFSRLFAAFRELEQNFSLSIYNLSRRMQTAGHAAAAAGERIRELIQRMIYTYNQRVHVQEAALMPLNPEAPLRRGYSIAYNSTGRVIKRAEDGMVGERIVIQLYKGAIASRVEERRNSR